MAQMVCMESNSKSAVFQTLELLYLGHGGASEFPRYKVLGVMQERKYPLSLCIGGVQMSTMILNRELADPHF